MKKYNRYILFILWLIAVIVYPALISIYVKLPLFIGFAGLVFLRGLDKERYSFAFVALLYMILLEINLSLPIGLIAIVSLLCYIFLISKLTILKNCQKCIDIIAVVSINGIYMFILTFFDILTSQSSIDFNITIIYSILFDIMAVFLI